MNNTVNTKLMLEWAQISAEMVGKDEVEAARKAKAKHQAYAARIAAGHEAWVVEVWNKNAIKGLKVGYVDLRIQTDASTQEVYRKMVRANARAV